jgi:hypothetical protein
MTRPDAVFSCGQPGYDPPSKAVHGLSNCAAGASIGRRCNSGRDSWAAKYGESLWRLMLLSLSDGLTPCLNSGSGAAPRSPSVLA